PSQFPGLEEWRPVDVRNNLIEGNILIDFDAGERRAIDLSMAPVDCRLTATCLFQFQQRLLPLPAPVVFTHFFLFASLVFSKSWFHLRALQIPHNPDCSRSI